jgi:hypothetical protein
VDIDEHLRRLTERHEALALFWEMLRLERAQSAREHQEWLSRITQYSADVKAAIARLANIADSGKSLGYD